MSAPAVVPPTGPCNDPFAESAEEAAAPGTIVNILPAESAVLLPNVSPELEQENTVGEEPALTRLKLVEGHTTWPIPPPAAEQPAAEQPAAEQLAAEQPVAGQELVTGGAGNNAVSPAHSNSSAGKKRKSHWSDASWARWETLSQVRKKLKADRLQVQFVSKAQKWSQVKYWSALAYIDAEKHSAERAFEDGERAEQRSLSLPAVIQQQQLQPQQQQQQQLQQPQQPQQPQLQSVNAKAAGGKHVPPPPIVAPKPHVAQADGTSISSVQNPFAVRGTSIQSIVPRTEPTGTDNYRPQIPASLVVTYRPTLSLPAAMKNASLVVSSSAATGVSGAVPKTATPSGAVPKNVAPVRFSHLGPVMQASDLVAPMHKEAQAIQQALHQSFGMQGVERQVTKLAELENKAKNAKSLRQRLELELHAAQRTEQAIEQLKSQEAKKREQISKLIGDLEKLTGDDISP